MNMDVDHSTLELMIKLLSVDSKAAQEKWKPAIAKDYERMKKKVTSIIAELKKDGGAKDIELNEISTGNLAMETLLSLTQRRTGDWFKEEMRGLGGLEFIVDSVSDASDQLDEDSSELTPHVLTRLKKIDRCLRVLENVTYLNSDNQQYLISYSSSSLISSVTSLLKICIRLLSTNPIPEEEKDKMEHPGRTVFNCILAILRVLLNITHDNVWGSQKVGQQDGLLSTGLQCTQTIPQHVPVEERFDLLVLSLGMMINLVEHCEINRRLLVNTEAVINLTPASQTANGESSDTIEALEAFTVLFNEKEAAAQQLEDSVSAPNSQKTGNPPQDGDDSGEWEESDSGLLWVIGKKKNADGESDEEEHIEIIPSSQEDNDNFTKALHKAGKHMEDSIVAAYVALLLGCIIQDNKSHVEKVRSHLTDGNFEPMVNILTKFLGFVNLTSTVGNNGSKSIARVIGILECF